MSDFIHKLCAWSHHKQYLGKSGESFDRVLHDIIAVYSSHPSGPLSLYARIKNFDAALFHEKEQSFVTRFPAMRHSVHLAPKSSAAHLFAATIPPAGEFWDKNYSQKGREIPLDSYPSWKEEILAFTQEPKLAKEIKAGTSIPDDKLKLVLNRMAGERFLVRVGAKSLRSNIISYVNASSWLGAPIQDTPKHEALTWLANTYFKAFGPARVKDFQWWAGTTATEAKQASQAAKLASVNEDYFIHEHDFDQFQAFQPSWNSPQLDILPQWDCYMMGYAPDGRQRFVSDEGQKIIYGKLGATTGNGLGTVLIDGYAQAAWTSKLKGTKMLISIKPIEPFNKKIAQLIEKEFGRVTQLLGAKSFQIEGW